MAFWNDAKNFVKQAFSPREQTGNMNDTGGITSYTPVVNKGKAEPQDLPPQPQPGGDIFGGMYPPGAQPKDNGTEERRREPSQPGQGYQQPPQPGYGATGYQQPPQPSFGNQSYQQPLQPGFGNQGYQQPGFGNQSYQQPNPQTAQPGYGSNMGNTGYQQPPRGFTAVQQPLQNDGQSYFAGGDSFVVDGNAYKLVMRVAQITGVPSCFRVIEFMYNNEAVIVNADAVTDVVEADRCMDLIFGAACAMKLRLMRVSGKQIYLITPPQVYVAPFEALRRAGMADIEDRWPGALQSSMQPQQPVNNVQYMNPQAMGNARQSWGYGQPRQDDFAGGMGRRASRNAAHPNGYNDFGGFGSRS